MVEFKCNTIGVDIRMKKELDNEVDDMVFCVWHKA